MKLTAAPYTSCCTYSRIASPSQVQANIASAQLLIFSLIKMTCSIAQRERRAFHAMFIGVWIKPPVDLQH
jgi:hypothetical protein